MSDPQRALRRGVPFWLRDASTARQRYPSSSGRHETDVAIVGGGMTGALVAHAFASAGVSTAIVEAAEIGRGSTAASSALLLQEPDLELTQLAARYGARAARRIWQLGHDSVRGLVSLLTRLHVRCDLTTPDTIYYATDAGGIDRLHRELALRSKLGSAAEWVGPVELRNITGIAGAGAIRTRHNAQFDPYRACAGVVRGAIAAGARVFERSKVRRIEAGPNGVRLRTPDGILDARTDRHG